MTSTFGSSYSSPSRHIAATVFFIGIWQVGVAVADDPIVRDQYHPGSNLGLQTVNSNLEIAQTFPLHFTGRLERVEVYINSHGDSSDVLWDIRGTVGGVPTTSNSSVLASGTIASAQVPVFPDLPPVPLELGSFNIQVHPGDILAVTLRTATVSGMAWYMGGPPNQGVYQRYSTETWSLAPWGNQSLGYATYVAIPEPLSVVQLIACGFAFGIRGHRRRRVALVNL